MTAPSTRRTGSPRKRKMHRLGKNERGAGKSGPRRHFVASVTCRIGKVFLRGPRPLPGSEAQDLRRRDAPRTRVPTPPALGPSIRKRRARSIEQPHRFWNGLALIPARSIASMALGTLPIWLGESHVDRPGAKLWLHSNRGGLPVRPRAIRSNRTPLRGTALQRFPRCRPRRLLLGRWSRGVKAQRPCPASSPAKAREGRRTT